MTFFNNVNPLDVEILLIEECYPCSVITGLGNSLEDFLERNGYSIYVISNLGLSLFMDNDDVDIMGQFLSLVDITEDTMAGHENIL